MRWFLVLRPRPESGELSSENIPSRWETNASFLTWGSRLHSTVRVTKNKLEAACMNNFAFLYGGQRPPGETELFTACIVMVRIPSLYLQPHHSKVPYTLMLYKWLRDSNRKTAKGFFLGLG